ncbi:uncharacterized protein [Penaeus vannamei]|uniref:uncharacterized protein n=1 Tax=Penaeus vannamei TaxID=6689 RepID=UPI00387F46CD
MIDGREPLLIENGKRDNFLYEEWLAPVSSATSSGRLSHQSASAVRMSKMFVFLSTGWLLLAAVCAYVPSLALGNPDTMENDKPGEPLSPDDFKEGLLVVQDLLPYEPINPPTPYFGMCLCQPTSRPLQSAFRGHCVPVGIPAMTASAEVF